MSELVPFDDPSPPTVTALGGKGASLARMRRAGLPVPDGFVLPAPFFSPWFDEVRRLPAFHRLSEQAPDAWRTDALVEQAQALDWSPSQQATLKTLRRRMGPVVAVRSSSPDEDLGTASFAGGYTTVLGVREKDLDDAVRRCFASALDARILRYKHQRGFDPFRPRIAVVVQTQIDSDVAGVGFSIDPLTNDYDHAVFDASWGLGESVVSGAVIPDHFVVDKVSGEVLAASIGSKGSSLGVGPDGVEAREPGPAEAPSLGGDQLRRLTELIVRVEAVSGGPVDIEWAVRGDELYLLQARPITTWVPLPASMRTSPGERRVLYQDLGLSGGLTINEPLSPMGQSWMERFASELLDTYVGQLPFDLAPGEELWFLAGGRMYQHLSNVLWLSTPSMLARGQDAMDPLMAETLRAIDRSKYVSAQRPPWVSLRSVGLYLKALWRLRRALAGALGVLWSPTAARSRYDAERARFDTWLRELPQEASVEELIDVAVQPTIRHVLETCMPPLLVAMGAQSVLQALAPARGAEAVDALGRGFSDNVVVQMGLAQYRLARLLRAHPDLPRDPEALAERLQAPPLADAWNEVVRRFGWRGPHEMDVARPRYQDDPVLVTRVVSTMAEGSFDPVEKHTEQIIQRQHALETLLQTVGPVRRVLFRWLDRRLQGFGGVRDDPKHAYLQLFARLRDRLLAAGRTLVTAGRLDAPEQVFDLRLDDLGADASVDLRARARHHRTFLDTLEVVRAFPAVIDSRGRIVRPTVRGEVDGELAGQPVSHGVVCGPVVILTRPDEKPVRPGDILVAHTTDPGWTPLFVNAAAVVLEVGGVLQHGAVVAREYGKPCVAGIASVLDRLQDGEIVEVDGTAGVVRRVT